MVDTRRIEGVGVEAIVPIEKAPRIEGVAVEALVPVAKVPRIEGVAVEVLVWVNPPPVSGGGGASGSRLRIGLPSLSIDG